MSAEFWSIVGAAVGLATLFVAYSQFILSRIDKVNDGVSELKQSLGELKGRVDELSGVVRATLPPRAA